MAQYAALFLLREIKHEGVDDSQYQHALAYVDLLSEQFKDIQKEDVDRLRRINVALKRIVQQRAVPDAQLRSALTAEQYANYGESFDYDISHVESDEQDKMPFQLRDYMDKIQEGDAHTRTANLFRRSKKRDALGRTAFGRYEAKAESCYEDAVMDLCNMLETDPRRNPLPDVKLANEIARWLDRDVSLEHGWTPDISAQGVPRVRGSKSKYSLEESQPVVGSRLRQHWRQRIALTEATLELLYEQVAEAVLSEQQHHDLNRQSQKLRALLAFRDGDED